MGVNIRVKRGKLYLDTYIQGKRTWESLGLSVGTDTLSNKEAFRLADIICKKREFQIASGEWGLFDSVAGKQSLVDYAAKYAAKQPPKNQLPKSLKYLREYGKDVRISSVNERFLEGYQEHLLESGLSKMTASMYYQALKTLLRRALRDRIISHNPADSVKAIKVPESVKVALTNEELQKLADVSLGGGLGAEIRRAFLFAAFTGLRISDLKDLKWGDIKADPLQVQKRQEKTGRVVVVDIHPTAWKLVDVDATHEPADRGFSDDRGNKDEYKPVPPEMGQGCKAGKASWLAYSTPHICRPHARRRGRLLYSLQTSWAYQASNNGGLCKGYRQNETASRRRLVEIRI